MCRPFLRLFCSLTVATVSWSASAQVPVKYPEGSLHGFLVLRSTDGEHLASGDLTQKVQGKRVTVRLTFHFKDGSLSDETAVYTQQRTFRLLTDRLIQKGPSFPHPIEVFTDTTRNEVTVRYTSDDGKEHTKTERMKLPLDLSNGLISTLLKNISPVTGETVLSMIVATPKPRIVKLKIRPQPESEALTVGSSARKATHFVIKIEIGGIAGVVSDFIGKEPHDSHVWILKSDVPAFLKSESQFYKDSPVWRIELTSPMWPEDKEMKDRP
jgi:hypothetical protein